MTRTRVQKAKGKGDRTVPVAVSYPGVYVEEIPSGVRTMTGVATSIAAFVGKNQTVHVVILTVQALFHRTGGQDARS